MPTPDTWNRCETAHVAAHAPPTEPSVDDCDRCLHPLSEHEFTTDRWGDSARVCPEEDWFDTDRELAWRRRQAGELR